MIVELGASTAGADVIRQLWREERMPSIRRWVVAAAGAASGRWVRPLLRAALADPAMTVRLHAICAIHQRGDRALAGAALALAADASGGIRTNCLALVAELKPPGWRAAIVRGIDDPKDYVRKQCRRILAAAPEGR